MRNGVEAENKDYAFKNIILCALPFVCSIVFRLLKLTNEADMQFLMRIALCAAAVYGVHALYRQKLDAQKMVFLIVIAGCIVRIGYTLYTHAFVRGMDVGINNGGSNGHWAYFYHILHGHLPPSNEYQFYQPPFYYMVSAVFIRIMMFIKGANEWGGFEYIPQLVSCASSIAVMIITVKIMDELNIEKKWQIIPISLLAFYPVQILVSSRMNNDAMVLMFVMMSLYATLRWHKSQKMQDIIFIAVSIGLGMMTKINCAIVAFVAGPLMIYHFVKAIQLKDRKRIKNMAAQLAVFAVICFPLGLWYGIRNYVLFDQPLNYVASLDTRMAIFTGNESFFDRWINFSVSDFWKQPYSDMGADCNVWMLLLRSGVHGEFTWDKFSVFFAACLDYIHLALMTLAIIAISFSMFKDKQLDRTAKFSALWVWVIVAVLFIQFNVEYTFSCTADFRYVMPAQIASSFFIAFMCKYCYTNR